MPWIEIQYMSPRTGRSVGHTAYCSSRREFADLMQRYEISAATIERLEIDGEPWDPGKLSKYF